MKDFDLKTPDGRHRFYCSTEWKKLRELKVATDPLCEECLKKGILTPVVDIHHITDLSKEPTIENALNFDGLLSLCKQCHLTITNKIVKPKWEPFDIKKFKSSFTNI